MSLRPVRIVYRSKKISIPLLSAMKACNAWESAGLDVQRLDYVSGAAKSDPMLIGGEVDFIFGSHVSPYIHRANGTPIVYLGQSVNWATDHLVTREPVAELRALRGKVLAEDKTKTTSHPWGNHKLYLQRGGVDLTEVDFVGADADEQRRKPFQLVADGVADAAIVMPPNDMLAKDLGLVVTPLPFLPMVQATTLTTMLDTRRNRPELCRAVIDAVRTGVRFFKHETEQMLKLMETEVAEELGVDSDRALHSLYHNNTMLLEETLYPRAEAILNAYRIAVLQDPSIQAKVNPLELWDLSLLQR
jgi:ABC-type nitrate/sulfonate/bicarbonate transport system substrate-binding protein